MEMASRITYFDRLKAHKNLFSEDQDVDTNIICIKFDSLKNSEKNIQMGDPTFCSKCHSCFNLHSVLHTVDEYKKSYPQSNIAQAQPELFEIQEEEKEPKPQQNPHLYLKVDDIKSHEKIWVCEFCDHHNIVSLELEEIPTKDDLVYVKQSASQVLGHSQSDNDISVVFCIDTSGSMSITTEVEGKHDLRHGLSPEEYEMLKQFIEFGADQYLPGQKKNTTFISRKQCVFAAIEQQLQDFIKKNPNRKVGLVTFSDEVYIIGDGSDALEVIAGDKLQKKDICLEAGIQNFEKFMSQPISKSSSNLLSKFNSIQANGRTALGPAIAASVGLASRGKQGSKLVICTDGMANVGIGDMEDIEAAEKFYNEIGEYAKSKDIMISIISIKGEGCKLETLSKLADLTNGDVTRVDPNQLTKDFANIFKDDVIGTKVNIKIRLHRGFKFREEAIENLSEGGSICDKMLGNVTAKTEVTFEYENKIDEELKAMGIDINNLKEIPFQVLISYISSEGHEMLRVITRKNKITFDQKQAEKDVKFEILIRNATSKQAEYGYHGNYKKSHEVARKWDTYLGSNVVQSNAEKAEVFGQYADYTRQNERLSGAVFRLEDRKKKAGIFSWFTSKSSNDKNDSKSMNAPQSKPLPESKIQCSEEKVSKECMPSNYDLQSDMGINLEACPQMISNSNSNSNNNNNEVFGCMPQQQIKQEKFEEEDEDEDAELVFKLKK